MLLRKSIFGTASMLGLAGILAFSGCSTDNSDGTPSSKSQTSRELGGLGLGLLLPDGSNVNSPTYIITRTSDVTFNMTGTLTISNGIATGTITGLPAGNDYKVVLAATRTTPAGAPDCSGNAVFSVIADQTTNVNVVLQCDDTSAANGAVTINGTFDICPKIGSTTVSPNSAAVGGSVALTGAATDKDVGDVVSYKWTTSTDGTFSSDSAASTSYTCVSAGSKTIQLNVTDKPGCVKPAAPITVTCTAASIDAGTPVVDSGTPVVDSGTPVVDSGTPVVDSGTPVIDSGTPVVDSGTPVVDSGVPAARFGSAACDTCVTASCTLYNDYDPRLDACKDAACDAAFACFQRNHCAVDAASVNKCYCGNVTNDACLVTGYVANGPCAAAANTAYGSTNTQMVFGLLYSSGNSFGNGAALFQCAAEACTTQCVTGTYPAP
ncbi:MAG: hypothetical protein JWN04_6600 [Myxococcaceae bacterium]|nr:hypothetical protein [Myxococcaceae bacterium]